MGDDVLKRHGIEPHAFHGRARWFLAGGSIITSVGLVFLGLQEVGSGLVVSSMGALLLLAGRQLREVSAVVPAVNTALQEARAGRFANASELLEYVSQHTDNSYVLRAVDQQRAQLACRRGDSTEVVRHASQVLERRVSWRHGVHGQLQTPLALGLRAFALASLDRHDEAKRDIQLVREHGVVTADALAYAELAQAVMLERRGERDALRAHLVDQRELLDEYTQPRERELVRALERMLEARAQSVYRKAAKQSADDVNVEDWIAAIAPEAAGFARSHGDAPLPEAPRQDDDRAKKAASSNVDALTKGEGNRQGRRVLLVWVVLVVVFLIVWTLLSPGNEVESAPSGEPWSGFAITLVPAVIVVGVVAAFLSLIVKGRSLQRRLLQAAGDLARGDHDVALAELDALTGCSQPLTAAAARDILAKWQARHGRVDQALTHIDHGLAKISNAQLRALASDQLLPSLLALRAWCLAALDRHGEAETTLTTLRTSFRAYYDLDAAMLRVRAIQAARAGDVAQLAALSDARAELGLSPRDELLLDLGRATVAPGSAGAGEIARLRKLLRQDGELIRWAKQLAPEVVAAFDRAVRPGPDAALA